MTTFLLQEIAHFGRMNFCVIFDEHLQFPGIFGTLRLLSRQTLSSLFKFPFCWSLDQFSTSSIHCLMRNRLSWSTSGDLGVLNSSYPVSKKSADNCLQISLRSRKWAGSKSCDRTERHDCSKDVFSGIFTGVGFKDQLSRYVKLPHNNIHCTITHTNGYAMRNKIGWKWILHCSFTDFAKSICESICM